MFNLETTPYLLDEFAAKQVKDRLIILEERVSLLRRQGILSEQTIKDYYGEKRFEQVAESNAIEGSTLSVGETELAVVKGVTITGHDPAFVRDAVALDKALMRITELARERSVPTDIQQLHEIHELLLGDRLGAGMFRKEKVIIRGAKHTPPKTWEQIMSQMTNWQNWSIENQSLPAPIRSTIMHAWLTHIHPYIDGNGRTSRAIGNLELIRAGYPSIIIKRKERDRYIEALAESDEGGDIRSFMELIFDRIEGSLIGLELSARKKQGYSSIVEKIRQRQEKQLNIWETGVRLLASIIEHHVMELIEPVGGHCAIKLFENPLDLDDYIEICEGRSVSRSWAFTLRIEIPGIPRLEKLVYVGHRSNIMYRSMNQEGGPSLYWAHKNPNGFPKWINDDQDAPYAKEMTSKIGNGDEWFVRLGDDLIERVQTTELAKRITDALVNQVYVS